MNKTCLQAWEAWRDHSAVDDQMLWRNYKWDPDLQLLLFERDNYLDLEMAESQIRVLRLLQIKIGLRICNSIWRLEGDLVDLVIFILNKNKYFKI